MPQPAASPARPACPACPARGWTLLEAMIVLFVVASLCGLALPPLQGVAARWRADLLRMQLVSTFNMARNTAITRHQPVAVCPSADGRQCGADWSRGWLIHRDDGPGQTSPADADILHFQPGSSARALRVHASQGRSRLRFQRDGRSSGSTLTVTLCAGGALHSEVIVNNVGRTRSTRARDARDCPD